MSLTLNMADDYRVWDNPETVRYQSRHKAVGPLDTVNVAKRRALTKKELLASAGVYTGLDLVWLLPQSELPQDFACKPGDVVIDDSENRWTALDAQHGKWRQTWRLTCRNLTLALDLRDKIQIERATIERDAAGAAVKRFPTGPQPQGGKTLYADLPARVQLSTQEIAEERGIRGFKGNYLIVVDREISVTNEDRVYFGGNYYEIVGYHNAQRIDELPVIDARLSP